MVATLDPLFEKPRSSLLSPTVLAVGAICAFWFSFSLYEIDVTGWRLAVSCFVAGTGVWAAEYGRRKLLGHLKTKGIGSERIAIYGASEKSIALARRIRDEGGKDGQVLVGVFDNRQTRVPEVANEFGLAGKWDTVSELAIAGKIDRIVICLPFNVDDRLHEILDNVLDVAVDVTLSPEDGTFEGADFDLAATPIKGWQGFVKILIDRIGGGLGLLAISPLLLLIGLLVKLDSKGPIFFFQERTGFNGRPFKIIKFRTMHGLGDTGQHMVQAHKGDPRVTPIGNQLRNWSLDELPQLINVVIGDMSLVGPRPHHRGSKAGERFFQDVIDGYAMRHRVKPGITGWAQVQGYRGETDTEEKLISRVRADLYYIYNWSVMFDIEILLRTIPAVLSARNSV